LRLSGTRSVGLILKYGFSGQKDSSLPSNTGKALRPAHQILYETEWLCGTTQDCDRIGKHTSILEDALRDTANADAIDEQSVIDGSWGR